MKPLIITGDIAAMGGIIGVVTHMIPETAGTIASFAAALWYGVMLWDRYANGKRSDDKHK